MNKRNKIKKEIMIFLIVGVVFILGGCSKSEQYTTYKLTYNDNFMQSAIEGEDYEVIVEKLDLESGKTKEATTMTNIYPIMNNESTGELIVASSKDGIVSISSKNGIKKIISSGYYYEFSDCMYYIEENTLYKYSNFKSEAIIKDEVEKIYDINSEGVLLYITIDGKLEVYTDGERKVILENGVDSAKIDGDYILINNLNGHDYIYILETNELISTNINIEDIIQSDINIFRIITLDNEEDYRVGNIEVLDLATGETECIVKDINVIFGTNVVYKDGYYYYFEEFEEGEEDLSENLVAYNEENKEHAILAKDILSIYPINDKIIYEKEDSFGYINSGKLEMIADSFESSHEYSINGDGYAYKTKDRKLNFNGKIIDENIDEDSSIKYYKGYIGYQKDKSIMVYDVEKEKIYNLGKVEESTYVIFYIGNIRFTS